MKDFYKMFNTLPQVAALLMVLLSWVSRVYLQARSWAYHRCTTATPLDRCYHSYKLYVLNNSP